MTGVRAIVRRGTEDAPDRTLVVDLYVRPGGAVMGGHPHPSIDERLTVLAGEVAFSIDGRHRMARVGETVKVRAGTVHDWWNAGPWRPTSWCR